MHKFYETGNEFFLDNKFDLLNNLIINQLIIKNSYESDLKVSKDLFFIKVYNDSAKLYMVYKKPFNLLLAGSSLLIDEAVDVLLDYNLEFKGILGEELLIKSFIENYTKKHTGIFNKIHIMSIMKNINENLNIHACVEKIRDIKDSYELIKNFHLEIYNKYLSEEEIINISNDLLKNDVYAIYDSKNILSMAVLSKGIFNLNTINSVYTKVEYRGLKLAQKLVETLSAISYKNGKIPTLFVDLENPISNKAYTNVGFEYEASLIEYEYIKGNYEDIVFAGGCFWCMAKPYYEYDGVLKVLNGYSGGEKVNPNYFEVKDGNTKHYESVKITFNKDKINFNQLLEIYLSSIDPFDDNGQYIDRGSSYKTAIFTNNDEYKKIIQHFFKIYEEEYKKEVKVKVLTESIFYKAEEYHQDYHIKNEEAYKQEFETSKRIKKPLIGRYFKDNKYFEIKVLDSIIIEKKEISRFENYNNPNCLLEIIEELKK